jgi:hypothetical protein
VPVLEQPAGHNGSYAGAVRQLAALEQVYSALFSSRLPREVRGMACRARRHVGISATERRPSRLNGQMRMKPKTGAGPGHGGSAPVEVPLSLMSDPAKAPREQPRYLFPEVPSAEERAQMARALDVDTEAYLRWLAGEGPDPCPSESSA